MRRLLPSSREKDEGTALVLVLLAMLVASMMAVLVLGAVVSQVRPTLVERQHVRALHASEAGISVVMGQIQAATKPDQLFPDKTVGDPEKLPCTSGSSAVVGQVDGQPGGYGYTVQVRYFLLDPAGQSADWRGAQAMACPLSQQPLFALVTSTGTGDPVPGQAAGAGSRTTELVYTFRVDNTNAVGGPLSTGSTCWDAATASTGTPITLQPCSAGVDRQRFAWRDDLTIILASSAATGPLCVTADRTDSNSTQLPAVLRPCDGTLHQSWGIDDSQHLYTTPTGTTGKWCLQATGGKLVAATGCGKVFTVDQAVGSGRAGSPAASQPGLIMQWVNYKEYGRCFDVNNWQITNDLILFPCKQDPATTRLRWNQGWIWGAADSEGRSELYTYKGSNNQDFVDAQTARKQRVCLDSTAGVGPALQLKACIAADPTSAPSDANRVQRWTVNRDVPTADNSGVDYATSYTIVDSKGNCLTAGARTSSTGTWSSVRLAPCDGSAAQKWNAPPTFTLASQDDFRETTHG